MFTTSGLSMMYYSVVLFSLKTSCCTMLLLCMYINFFLSFTHIFGVFISHILGLYPFLCFFLMNLFIYEFIIIIVHGWI